MRPITKTLFIGIALLISACDRHRADEIGTVTVDTLPNGTAHVVNRPSALEGDSIWTLQEELRIGAVDDGGPTSFGQIKGIAVAQDGRIAVLDAHAQEIRVFDSTGKHLVTHGRQGAGPGEFAGAWGLMLGSGGMMWVPDHANARMSVVDFEKGFVTSYPMQVRGYGWVWQGTIDNDGRILELPLVPDANGRNYLRIYDKRMTFVDSLLLPPDPPIDPMNPPWTYRWESQGNQSSGYISIPFVAVPLQRLDPSGVIWSTSGDKYRIVRWQPGGDTTLVIETVRTPVGVTAVERDSAIGGLRKYFREQGTVDADWSRIPKTKPAILRMFLGDKARLWVETASPDSLRRFDVYEPEGKIVGTVKTALRLNRWVPPVVRGEALWAVVVDDMDVQYVVRARLIKAAEGRDR